MNRFDPSNADPEVDPRSGADRRAFDDNVLAGTDRRRRSDRRKEDLGPTHRENEEAP